MSLWKLFPKLYRSETNSITGVGQGQAESGKQGKYGGDETIQDFDFFVKQGDNPLPKKQKTMCCSDMQSTSNYKGL